MNIGLTKEQYASFVKDALRGSIIVGGKCTTGCIFCACNVSKPAINRTNWINFISREDLISVLPLVGKLAFTEEQKRESIENGIPFGMSFGDGNYFNSCEPFLHPFYDQLIEIINDYYPDWVKYTATIGKGIDPKHYDLFRRANMSFYVSVNSLDQDRRQEIMRSRDDYEGVVNFLRDAHDMIYRVSLIHTGDVDQLKRDIEKLYKIHPSYQDKSIRLWITDYSKYSSKRAKELYTNASETWFEAVRVLYEMNKDPLPSVPKIGDNDFPLEFPNSDFYWNRNDFDSRIERVLSQLNQRNIDIDSVGFIIPESTWEYSKKWDDKINRIYAENISFGGSYVISALLSKNDILHAIDRERKYDYYVVAKETFDEFGEDIAGNNKSSYGVNMFIA